MDFRYSIELPAAENPTDGMAGNVPVRRHCDHLLEDVGALRAQEDWAKLVGPLQNFKERLGVIAYASEIGFLYDDCTEFLNKDEVNRANNDMQSAFTEGVQRGKIDGEKGGVKAVQAILFGEMMAIDKPRALTAMNVWIEFLSEAVGRQHAAAYKTFEEYMRYRVLDVGEMFWFGLVTFGMALTIPEDELSTIRTMSRPCWIVLALQNDICSYSKEVEAACEKDASSIFNAIWILMREHNIDLKEAKAICRRHIEANVAEYQPKMAECKCDKNISQDAKVYLESLLYTISGDAAWSLITLRYNSNEQYNEQQICMMRDGVNALMEEILQEKPYLSRSIPSKNPRELDANTKLPALKTVA